MIHFRLRYEGLRRRMARRRRRVAVLRAAWLSMVPVALALVVAIAVRQPPSPRVWVPASAVVLVVAAAWIARPRSLREIGHALDNAFALEDLLVTALEVDRRGPQGSLETSLLDDAATALAEIEADVRLAGDSALAEAEALAGMVAVVAGLYLLAAVQAGGAPVPRLGPLSAPGEGATAGLAPPDQGWLAPTAVSNRPAAGDAAEGHGAGAADAASGSVGAPGAWNAPGSAAAPALAGHGPGRLTTPAPLFPAAAAWPLAPAPAGGTAQGRGASTPGDGAAVSSAEVMVRGGGQGRGAAVLGAGSLPWNLRAAIRRYFGGQ